MICSDCGQDWRGGHVCEVDHLKEMLAQARKLESGINKSACLLMAGGEKLLAERDQQQPQERPGVVALAETQSNLHCGHVAPLSSEAAISGAQPAKALPVAVVVSAPLPATPPTGLPSSSQ